MFIEKNALLKQPPLSVSKGELDAHSRKHTGLHPFVCELCGASFTTSSSLVKHNRIHTGERVNSCQTYPRMIQSNVFLFISSQPYACEYCPMRFAALGTLKNHTRTHNGARPFACGICGRKFSQRSDCLSHQETHTGTAAGILMGFTSEWFWIHLLFYIPPQLTSRSFASNVTNRLTKRAVSGIT